MNVERRRAVREALGLVSQAISILESTCEQEEDALDNFPENLQSTDRYEQMEENLESLMDAIEQIESAKDQIEQAIS